MKQKVKLGVVCLARTTFEHKTAQEMYNKTKEDLKKIENTEWEIIEETVIEINDAEEAAKKLSSANVDAVVVISGTFHLGHLILYFQKIIEKPVLLWAYNELPYDGGKIRLNSVCGLNLNASNLYKSGVNDFYYTIGDKIDEDWVDAIRIKTALKNARLGILGSRAHGFFNMAVDELNNFRESGVIIDYYRIDEVFGQNSENAVKNEAEDVKKIYDTASVTAEQVNKVANLSLRLKEFMDRENLSGLAVRCWPEFAANYGVAPCASMSKLQGEGYLLSCEGDIQGLMSMLAHKVIGAKTPFLADLSQVNLEEDYSLMWHCGVAPSNLCDGKCQISLDTYFAGGKGVTADFVMKEGDVNIMRIDTALGKTRIFMQEGKAEYMEKLLRGTYAKVRFEKHMTEVLDLLIYNGIAHHVSLVYGRYARIFKILGRIMNWEVIS